MNRFNRYILFVICSIGFAVSARPQDALQQIDQANAVLDSDHLFELLAEAKRNNWSAWPVHSQWAVERMTGDNKLVAERAISFGRKLSKQLDQLAVTITQQSTYSHDERMVFWLSDLGNWITSGVGSGNALIARRSLDLATLPMSRLIIDKATTTQQLEIYAALLQPRWDSVSYRARVLNVEMGQTLFDPEGSSAQLRATYQREAGAAAWAAIVKAGVNPQENELIQNLPRSVDAQNLTGFFAQESSSTPFTTTDRLNLRNIGLIVSGLSDINARHLLALIKYRQRTGKLPELPDGVDSSRAVAAWHAQLTFSELKNDELRTLGGIAGDAHARIAHGRFTDRDSFESHRRQSIPAQSLRSEQNGSGRNMSDSQDHQ